MLRHYLREGNVARAKEIAVKLKPKIVGCLSDSPAPNQAALDRQAEAAILADPDPEPHYEVAQDFLFCGYKEMALEMIKSAIDHHFCAYSGLQNDSAWAKLRGTPEFAELVSAAKQCRDDFMAERDK
jgi:hypothetical protein